MADPTFGSAAYEGVAAILESAMNAGVMRARLATGNTFDANSSLVNLSGIEVSGNGYPVNGFDCSLRQVAFNPSSSLVEGTFDFVVTPTGGAIEWEQLLVTIDFGQGQRVFGFLKWDSLESVQDGETREVVCTLNIGTEGAIVNQQ